MPNSPVVMRGEYIPVPSLTAVAPGILSSCDTWTSLCIAPAADGH
jgi:hypothetical protein